MTRTPDTLEGIAAIAMSCRQTWSVYYAQVEANAEPSMATGGEGRPSGVSDPTLAAVLAAQPHLDARRQLQADIVGVFHTLKSIERRMVQVVNEPKRMTDRERARASCHGGDPLCGAWADDGRGGMCDTCWRAKRTAQRAEQRARQRQALDSVAAP